MGPAWDWPHRHDAMLFGVIAPPWESSEFLYFQF